MIENTLRSLDMRLRSPLALLLVFTLLHGLWYVLIIQPWQAPDEYVHYEYLRGYLASPTLDPFRHGRNGSVQQELIGSLLTFEHFRYRLAPTPPEAELRSNETPLGASRVYPHPPTYYLLSAPFYALGLHAGPLVQLYLLRIFSVLLACLTVFLTYQLCAEVFRAEVRPWLALIPAALLPVLPQYAFISASYNNDNLVPPLVTLSLIFLIRGYRHRARPRSFLLGVAFGLLAMMAKRTAVGILPVLGLALLAYAQVWRRSDLRWARGVGRAVWIGLGLFAALAVLILTLPPVIPAGLARLLRTSPNVLVDLSRLDSFNALRDLDWRFFVTFGLKSFWGWFGWLTLAAPRPVYVGLALLSGLLGFGLVVAVVRAVRGRPGQGMLRSRLGLGLLLCGAAFTLLAMTLQYAVSPQAYPPQGRYLFPFLPGLAILGTWSWLSFWPRRWQGPALFAAWAVMVAYDVYAWAYLILPGWYS